MATHSSILAWRIPGMGEPGGLPSMGSHRVGHDWSDLAAAAFSIAVDSDSRPISGTTGQRARCCLGPGSGATTAADSARHGRIRILSSKNPPASAGDTTDAASIPGPGRYPGGGHGNPLQYSCLENPMDRGAWWATVPGVAKSQTGLSDLTFIHSIAKTTKNLLNKYVFFCKEILDWTMGWIFNKNI